MKTTSTRIAFALLTSLAALGALSATPAAQAQVGVNVQIGPPPPPQREVMPPPRHGYAWAPGYWAWDGRHHVWVGGHWERMRRGYARYEPAHWQQGPRGGWRLIPGHWVR